jgi:hypothetical protein
MPTPIEVGELLGQYVNQIGRITDELAEADLAATRAKVEYDRAYAIAFRQCSGSIEARRHMATETTHGRRLEAEERASEVRKLKAQIRVLETRIDVGRSFGAALRAEAAAVNTQWTEG